LFFFVVVAVGADVVGEGGKLLLTESNVRRKTVGGE